MGTIGTVGAEQTQHAHSVARSSTQFSPRGSIEGKTVQRFPKDQWVLTSAALRKVEYVQYKSDIGMAFIGIHNALQSDPGRIERAAGYLCEVALLLARHDRLKAKYKTQVDSFKSLCNKPKLRLALLQIANVALGKVLLDLEEPILVRVLAARRIFAFAAQFSSFNQGLVLEPTGVLGFLEYVVNGSAPLTKEQAHILYVHLVSALLHGFVGRRIFRELKHAERTSLFKIEARLPKGSPGKLAIRATLDLKCKL